MSKEGCLVAQSSSMLWMCHVLYLWTSIPKCLLSWHFGCLSWAHAPAGNAAKKAMTNLPVSGAPKPWHQFLKKFYLGDINSIFSVSKSCFLPLRLLFPLWVAFLYNLQMSAFSSPTDSLAIRRLLSVTLQTLLFVLSRVRLASGSHCPTWGIESFPPKKCLSGHLSYFLGTI